MHVLVTCGGSQAHVRLIPYSPMWHPQPGLRPHDPCMHAGHVGPLMRRAHKSLILPIADAIAAGHVADMQC